MWRGPRLASGRGWSKLAPTKDAYLPTYQTAAYFEQLTHTPYKRWVQLGEGTHTVMLEKNRMQFIHAVVAFLEEPDPQALGAPDR